MFNIIWRYEEENKRNCALTSQILSEKIKKLPVEFICLSVTVKSITDNSQTSGIFGLFLCLIWQCRFFLRSMLFVLIILYLLQNFILCCSENTLENAKDLQNRGEKSPNIYYVINSNLCFAKTLRSSYKCLYLKLFE